MYSSIVTVQKYITGVDSALNQASYMYKEAER